MTNILGRRARPSPRREGQFIAKRQIVALPPALRLRYAFAGGLYF